MTEQWQAIIRDLVTSETDAILFAPNQQAADAKAAAYIKLGFCRTGAPEIKQMKLPRTAKPVPGGGGGA